MTPEEIPHADIRELHRRRTELLQASCPLCDEGQVWASCTCTEDLWEAELIEKEIRDRGNAVS